MIRRTPRGSKRRPLTLTGPLAGVARRGATFSAVTLVLVQGIAFGSTLVLARLLSPEEVGVFAAGTVLSGFLTMFVDSGMKNALVQRRDDVEAAADTVFWATLVGGLLIGLLAFGAAPLVGMLFRSHLAAEIAAVTAGLFVLQAATVAPDAIMVRRFDAMRRLIVDPARSIAYGATAIGCAVAGFGVWALVIGTYAQAVVGLIGTWSLARWRPGRGASVRLWRELGRFGLPILVLSLSWRVRGMIQTALLGRTLGESALGQYRYGTRLGELPRTAIIQIGAYAILPTFARISEDPDRFRRGFLRAMRWSWLLAVPVTGLIVALGEPAVVVMLGERWRPAGTFLMASGAIAACVGLHEVCGEAIKAAGDSKRLHWISVIVLVAGLGLLVALLPLGLLGVGLAASATEVLITAASLVLARRVVGLRMRELVPLLAPAAVATVVAAGVIGAFEWLVGHSDRLPVALGILQLTGLTIAFAVVYLLVLRVLDPPTVQQLVGGVRSKLPGATASKRL
ncbi:MAG: oligosaccharide flippase family protein [Pseudonocardia sp.]